MGHFPLSFTVKWYPVSANENARKISRCPIRTRWMLSDSTNDYSTSCSFAFIWNLLEIRKDEKSVLRTKVLRYGVLSILILHSVLYRYHFDWHLFVILLSWYFSNDKSMCSDRIIPRILWSLTISYSSCRIRWPEPDNSNDVYIAKEKPF